LAFDPFQEDLLELQKKDPTLKFLDEQMKKNQWLKHFSTLERNFLIAKAQKL
jgi:hypothetical protein